MLACRCLEPMSPKCMRALGFAVLFLATADICGRQHAVHRSRLLGSSLALGIVSSLLVAGAPSCGGEAPSSRPSGANATGSGGAADGAAGSGLFGNAGTFFTDASLGGEGSVGSMQITPGMPVIDVTIVDGVVTITGPDGGSASITFQATSNGSPVSPMWSIDKGELGTIDVASGAFTTTGQFSGVAKVSATLGNVIASTTVTVRLH